MARGKRKVDGVRHLVFPVQLPEPTKEATLAQPCAECEAKPGAPCRRYSYASDVADRGHLRGRVVDASVLHHVRKASALGLTSVNRRANEYTIDWERVIDIVVHDEQLADRMIIKLAERIPRIR